MKDNINYKDLNLLFRVSSGDLIITNEEVINQSIANILGTSKKARVFKRRFGSDIHSMLFELIEPLNISSLRSKIFDALDQWEPRISLNSEDVVIVATEDNLSISITIFYTIRGTQSTGTFNDIINLS